MRFKGSVLITICYAMCILLIPSMFFSSCKKHPALEKTGYLDETAQTIAAAEVETEDGLGATLTVSGEKTFYNKIVANVENLPVEDLSKALSTIGVADDMKTGYFISDLLGRYYYSVDLSKLIPVCLTPENELVCRFNTDASIEILVVLDSAENPENVRYYLSPEWSVQTDEVTFLLDERIPQEEETNLCRQLFLIHTQAEGLEKAIILDGDRTTHVISVCFERYPGLKYHFPYYQYQDFAGQVLYCLHDECMVRTELH